MVDYQQWIRHYPCSIFGITQQTEATDFPTTARLMDLHRLALESDAPYLGNPYQIHVQAEAISRHRNLPTIYTVVTYNIGW